ncbi:DUF4124 domain-containing protein [Pseudomonas sp. B392_1p]|uniref:DUF4124 domain-containing protein n=1 Tax=Pseudomonas sp. B392_1p TaxID=3457507 RepID=UPI003FD3A90A
MRLAFLGLALVSLPLYAQIYTHVDAEGNRVFSGRPLHEHSQPVALPPINRLPPALPVEAQPRPAAPSEYSQAQTYQIVRILHPAADATYRDGAGDLSVLASSEPALHPGHAYQLLLDGQPLGSAASQPRFQLHNLDRGSHRLAVEIVDAIGTSLIRSAEQTVHIHRPSLAQKRRVRPCQRDDYGRRLECPMRDKPVEKRDIPYVPFF